MNAGQAFQTKSTTAEMGKARVAIPLLLRKEVHT